VAASATEHTAVILSDDDDDALFLVSNESAGDDVARARARLLLAPRCIEFDRVVSIFVDARKIPTIESFASELDENMSPIRAPFYWGN